MMPIHGVNEWSELVLNTLVKTFQVTIFHGRFDGWFVFFSVDPYVWYPYS